MIALGLDPGVASFGWGLVERVQPCGPVFPRRAGTIHTRSADRLEDRLAKIERVLVDLLLALPDEAVVGIEDAYIARRGNDSHYVDPDGILQCAKSIGVGFTVFSRWRPTLFRNVQWWRAIGAGHGSPSEVREALKKILGPIEGKTSEHSRDALGVAICALGAGRRSS